MSEIKGTDVVLQGKVALVTGASRGIGRATAERLSRAGAKLVITARTEAALAETVAAISNRDNNSGREVISVACDVGEFQQVEATVARVKDTFGQLDIIVNNAGTIAPIARLEDGSPEEWFGEVQDNLLGLRIVGLSPGTVATNMMEQIKESGINPVSQLDWSVHISPEWAAEAVLFLCGPGGDAYLGTDFSIKVNEGRSAVGLPLK